MPKSRGCRIVLLILCLIDASALAEENFPIRIAVEFTDHAASAYVAQDKGWFRQEGLRPTFYRYITGMSLAAALGRGEIQAAYLCLLPAINAYANAGVKIKIVTGLHKNGYALAVDPGKVKTVKDLERPGVRIGCVQVGGPTDAMLLKTIEHYGLDGSKILNKVRRMTPPMQMMAVRMGQLDASFTPEHWPSLAEDAGFQVLLTSADVWPSMQGSVLVVKEELMAAHPDIVRKLVNITAKAGVWVKQNPEEAARVMAGQLQLAGKDIFPMEAKSAASTLAVTPRSMASSMKRLEFTADVGAGDVQEVIDFAARHGYIRKGFDAEKILDLRFAR
jgi:NitT/TauT family transport system substrate-binding protein